MAAPTDRLMTLVLSGDELALLKKLDFPCSERVLATARPGEEGLELTGSWSDFDSLAGWVAGEANDAHRHRHMHKARLLDSIAEQLEAMLSAHRR